MRLRMDTAVRLDRIKLIEINLTVGTVFFKVEHPPVLSGEGCILCGRCSAIIHSVSKYRFTNVPNRVRRYLTFLLYDCYMMFLVRKYKTNILLLIYAQCL